LILKYYQPLTSRTPKNPKMSIYRVISESNGDRLAAQKPPQPLKAKDGSAFTGTFFTYNYGDEQRPVWSEPLFELQICKGTVKRNEKGKMKLNLVVTDENDLKGMSNLFRGIATVVNQFKNIYGVFDFNPASPSGLRGIHFYPRDQKTGELVKGGQPIVSLKHNDKSKYSYLEILKNPDGSAAVDQSGQPAYNEIPIDYNTLEGRELQCSVVVCVRDLYHATGMPLPRVYVRSCMVLSASEKGSVDHTKSETVRKYLAANPEMIATLYEQMQKQKKPASLFDKPGSGTPTPSLLALTGPASPAQTPSISNTPSLQSTPALPQLPAAPPAFTNQASPSFAAPPAFAAPPTFAGQASPQVQPVFAAPPTFAVSQPTPAPPQFSHMPTMPSFPGQQAGQPQLTPQGTVDMNAFLQQQMASSGLSVTRI